MFNYTPLQQLFSSKLVQNQLLKFSKCLWQMVSFIHTYVQINFRIFLNCLPLASMRALSRLRSLSCMRKWRLYKCCSGLLFSYLTLCKLSPLQATELHYRVYCTDPLLDPLLFILSTLWVKKHPCRLLSTSSYLLIDLIFKMDSHCTLLVLMWSSLYDRMYADDICVCLW